MVAPTDLRGVRSNISRFPPCLCRHWGPLILDESHISRANSIQEFPAAEALKWVPDRAFGDVTLRRRDTPSSRRRIDITRRRTPNAV